MDSYSGRELLGSLSAPSSVPLRGREGERERGREGERGRNEEKEEGEEGRKGRRREGERREVG